MELTQQVVKDLFEYKDGNLYWKNINKYCHNTKNGDKAGSLNNTGRYSIKINNKSYLSHRIIYLYHHGYLPNEIDHIDRNPTNNKIENLREVTRSQNIMNSNKQKTYNNKPTASQYKGVSWHKVSQKWVSYINYNKTIHLGSFKSELDAAKCYNKAAIKYYGEYANLNEV